MSTDVNNEFFVAILDSAHELDLDFADMDEAKDFYQTWEMCDGL